MQLLRRPPPQTPAVAAVTTLLTGHPLSLCGGGTACGYTDEDLVGPRRAGVCGGGWARLSMFVVTGAAIAAANARGAHHAAYEG